MSRTVGSADLKPIVSRTDVHVAIAEGLRRYVGRGRAYSVKQLANASGVADRLIECACNEVGTVEWRALPVEKLLSLAVVLGPDFTNAWLSLAGQGSFSMATTIEPSLGHTVAVMVGDAAEFASYAADNKISAAERPALLALAARKAQQVRILMRMGRGP